MTIYRGIVEDSEDPDKLGRLKLRVPALLGSEVTPDWVDYRAAGASKSGGPSWFVVPEKETQVTVEVDGAGRMVWTGAVVHADLKPAGPLGKAYGKRAGGTSPKGKAFVILDDDAGAMLLGSAVRLASSEEATTQAALRADDTDGIIDAICDALIAMAGTLSSATIEPAALAAGNALNTAIGTVKGNLGSKGHHSTVVVLE